MRIIVIGGSRGLGLETAKVALVAGHDVTIFSRHADSAGLRSKKLSHVSGNVLDIDSVVSAIRGHDAVICALGLPTLQAIGPPFASKSYVISKGTTNIIKAMEKHKIKRFICVTAIAVGDSKKYCTPASRILLPLGLHWLFEEKERQETIIKKSGIHWTIIRPSALTNARRSKQYAVQDSHHKFGLLSNISRHDVANEMIRIIDKPSTFRQAIVLSYAPRFGDSLRFAAGYFKIT